MIPIPELKQDLLQNFLFILFNVTMAVYYIELLEKWPKIGRFAQAAKEIYRRQTNSIKIMVVSWSLLVITFFLSLLVMGYYFSSLPEVILDVNSFVFYVICLLCFILIPKSTAGLIVGITVALCPYDFWIKLNEAYGKEKTVEEVYLSKEYINEFDLRSSAKRCRRHGIAKSLGNLLWLSGFLLVPKIGSLGLELPSTVIPLLCVGIIFVIAFCFPILEQMYANRTLLISDP